MNSVGQKTLAEHLEFVKKTAALAFYFSHHLHQRRPEESLEFILRQRSPLYHVALDLDPEVPLELFSALPDCAGAEEFEQLMMERSLPFLLQRGAERYPESLGMGLHGEWQTESLKYDPPQKGRENFCFFHIGNGKAPGSIFDDPDYLPQCLLQLTELAQKEYGFTEIGTNSWLNSNPRWLRLFPEAWQRNREERSSVCPLWHLGYWGQLVTARGLFNEKTGSYIRQHGKMRYPTSFCRCGMEELRRHLRTLL